MDKPIGFFKLHNDLIPALCKFFRPGEVVLILYLLTQQSYFGNKEFYRTDKQIMEDLNIPRATLHRYRENIQKSPFVQIKTGKFKGAPTRYYFKGFQIDTL